MEGTEPLLSGRSAVRCDMGILGVQGVPGGVAAIDSRGAAGRARAQLVGREQAREILTSFRVWHVGVSAGSDAVRAGICATLTPCALACLRNGHDGCEMP